MKTSSVSFTTHESVQDVATHFRLFATSKYSGAVKLAAGLRRITGTLAGATGVEFFTPKGDDQFDAIDTDPPSFSVGASIPKLSGTGDGNVVIQLYLWERGTHRDGRIITAYSLGARSASLRALDEVTQVLLRTGAALRNLLFAAF
jgi:hypothetical protein